MPNTNNSYAKDRCLCGVHVHVATKIIAWINIIFTFLGIVLTVVTFLASPSQLFGQKIPKITTSAFVSSIIFTLIYLEIYGLLLYGVIRKRPVFYLPYLLLTGINILTSIICAVIATIGLIAIIFESISSDTFKNVPIILLVVVEILLILIVAVIIYFFFIIPNRSRKLVEAELFNATTVRVSPDNDRAKPLKPNFY